MLNYFTVKATTRRGQSNTQQWKLSICGLETVLILDTSPKLIYFDDETVYEFEKKDYASIFMSNSEECPVANYTISQSEMEVGGDQIIYQPIPGVDGTILIYKDVNETLQFNFT